MVDFFFHLASKWLKWCAQTLHPFSPILKIFPRIDTLIVAPPSNSFQICSIRLIGATCRPAKKTQNKPASKSNTGRAALRVDPAGNYVHLMIKIHDMVTAATTINLLVYCSDLTVTVICI